MQGQQRQLYLKYTKTLYKTNKRKIQTHTIQLQNNNQISQTELLKLRIKSKFHKSAKSQNKYLSQYFITNPYVSASAVIDYRLG